MIQEFAKIKALIRNSGSDGSHPANVQKDQNGQKKKNKA